MAQDISNFIDLKLIAALEKINKELIAAGQNADKLIPAITQLNSVSTELGKTLNVDAEAQKKMVAAQKEAESIEKQLLTTEAKLNNLNSESNKLLTEQKAKLQAATQAEKDKKKANDAAEGSLVRMRMRLKELTLEYDKAGKRTKEATKEINDLSKEIMKAEQATNRHGRNVGNYTSVWDKFKDTTSLLPGQLGNIASAGENVVTKIASLGPVGGMVAGTIIAAGAGLTAFFTATEKGAEMMERKWAGMKAAWKTLVGEIAKGGEDIAQTFEEPKKGQFWEKLFYTTGSLVGQKFAKGVAEIGMKMDGASYAAEQYTKVLQDVEDEEKRLLVPRALATDSLTKAYEIYNDTEKALDVRKKSLQDIIKLEDDAAAEEIRLQSVKVAALKEIKNQRDLDGLDATEARNNLFEAESELIRLGTESASRKRRTVKMIIGLDKEEVSSAKEKNKIFEENEKKRAEAEKKLSDERVKKWADETWAKAQAIDEEKKLNEMYFASFAELIDEETKLKDKQLDDEIKATIDAGEKILDEKQKLSEKEIEQRKKNEEDFKQMAIQQGIELGNYLFDSKKKQLELEYQAAEGNETRQKELKKKIAQADKKQALFNIAVNTAVAVSKVLGQTGIFGLAAWIPVAALGAVQAAMVAAQKVPEFAKGTAYAPGGVALVGERGRELIKRPNGQIYLANNPALVNLERGSKVLTNRQTEAILKDGNIVSELRQTRKAIQNIPQPVFLNGSKISERSGNYWKDYRNYKHRLN